MQIQNIYDFYKKNIEITGVTCDSRKVKQGYIFVAIEGKKDDGHKYIKDAIKKGAAFIVSQKWIPIMHPHVYVKDSKKEYITILQKFYGYTSKIYCVGVTGTDGKTTTSTILNHILNFQNGCCYIGTNGIEYKDTHINNYHTTPIPETLYEVYSNLLKENMTDLVMEVSSEGLVDQRVSDFCFHGAIFTNLSHEHFDTHNNMIDYFKAKAKLFQSLPRYGLAVTNSDDEFGRYIKYYTQAKVITYGIKSGMYQAKNISIYLNHTTFDLYYFNKFRCTINSNLFGTYNIYNTLAAIAYTSELGIPMEIIKRQISTLFQIPGRFEMYKTNDITTIVDFAHTPNAIYNLLSNLQKIAHNKIILVLGAAGEKDTTKRGMMGQTAQILADTIIFTSEDPKHENLFGILYDLVKDCKLVDYYITYSRKDAIKLAVSLAKKGDFIVITGKGNEVYEQIEDYYFRHNDMDVLQKTFNTIQI